MTAAGHASLPSRVAAKPDKQDVKPVDPATRYEAAQEELEEIIRRIEAGEVGLEESMAQYERGVLLVKHCRELLDKVEQKFTDLTAQMQDKK